MELLERMEGNVALRLSDIELAAMSNALNEVLYGPEAIPDWEFHTRVGIERSDAQVLLKSIAEALKGDGGIR